MSLARSEQLVIITPPGGTVNASGVVADGRDALGFVDESLAAGSAGTTGKTLWGTVTELSAEEAVRAGLKGQEGAYRIKMYKTSLVTPGVVLRRVQAGTVQPEHIEVTSVQRHYQTIWMMAMGRRSLVTSHV